jgi:hypothetical protein
MTLLALRNFATVGVRSEVLLMPHFPKADRGRRALRLRLLKSLPVTIPIANSTVITGLLQTISTTGGRARLSTAVSEGELVEVQLKTPRGYFAGLAEMLAPRRHGSPEQAFRFIGMSDEDQTRLAETMDYLRRTGVAEPSGMY